MNKEHVLFPLPPLVRPGLSASDLDLIRAVRRLPKADQRMIADVTGQTIVEIRRRLKRLRTQGILIGVRAVVRLPPPAVGALQILCGVAVGETARRQAFIDAALRHAEIVSCYRVAADFDYLLHIVVPGMARFRALVSELPGVDRLTIRTLHGSIPLHHPLEKPSDEC